MDFNSIVVPRDKKLQGRKGGNDKAVFWSAAKLPRFPRLVKFKMERDRLGVTIICIFSTVAVSLANGIMYE